jgi:hypothetical protein
VLYGFNSLEESNCMSFQIWICPEKEKCKIIYFFYQLFDE